VVGLRVLVEVVLWSEREYVLPCVLEGRN
jgi:hypothetical protein